MIRVGEQNVFVLAGIENSDSLAYDLALIAIQLLLFAVIQILALLDEFINTLGHLRPFEQHTVFTVLETSIQGETLAVMIGVDPTTARTADPVGFGQEGGALLGVLVAKEERIYGQLAVRKRSSALCKVSVDLVLRNELLGRQNVRVSLGEINGVPQEGGYQTRDLFAVIESAETSGILLDSLLIGLHFLNKGGQFLGVFQNFPIKLIDLWPQETARRLVFFGDVLIILTVKKGHLIRHIGLPFLIGLLRFVLRQILSRFQKLADAFVDILPWQKDRGHIRHPISRGDADTVLVPFHGIAFVADNNADAVGLVFVS